MKSTFNCSFLKITSIFFSTTLLLLSHLSGYSQTAFSPGNLVLLRTSTGSTGTYGSQVFLDEYSPAGVFARTLTLPITSAPSLSLNNSIHIAGTTGSNSSADEGRLSLSSNGQYLTFAGYANANSSSASQSSSIGYPRTIARVKYDGTTSFFTPSTLAATATGNINIANNSPTFTINAAGSGTIATGQYVFGPGITLGTTVQTTTPSYTFSANATATGTGYNLSFVAPSVFAAVATGGTTSSGSTSVTGLTVASGSITNGLYVYGTNIAGGSTVTGFSAGTLTLSNGATNPSSNQTLFFTNFPLYADRVAARSAFTTDGANYLLATAENTIQYYNSNGTTPSGVLANTTGSITNLANGSSSQQARYFFPYNNKIYMSNGLGNNKLAVISNSSSIPTTATAPTGFTYATGSATPFSPTNLYIVSQNGTDVLYVGEVGQTVTSNSTYPSSAVSSGATTVTVNSASGIAVGQYVSGTGIQTGTYVKGISGTTITLSQATNRAIASSSTVTTSVLTFSGQQTTSSTASGNTTISVASGTNIVAGQFVVATSGGNISSAIPANTIVTNVSGTNITLSNATTASLSGLTLTFHYYGIKKYYYNTTNSNWVAVGGYGVSSDQFQGIVVSPPSTNSATIYAVRNAPATSTTAAGTLISFTDGAGATANFSLSGSESNLKVSTGGTFRSLAFAPFISTTNYYYNGTGDVTSTSSWGTNTDGTGINPTDFTSVQQVFNLRNAALIPALTSNWTVSGTDSKIVVGDGTNACTFTIPSGFTVTGTVDVAANGTLSIANTVSPTFGILSSSGTVTYSGTVAQTIPSGSSFSNLSITNTNATVSAGGAFSVSTSINIASGANLDMVTYPLTFTGTTTSGTGTLLTQNTSATPFPTSKTWNFQINFNRAAGGQTIPTNSSTTFNGLIISNTSGTISPSGTLTVNGNLDLTNSGSTLNMLTQSLVCGTGFTTSGSGTLYSQNVTGSGALNTHNIAPGQKTFNFNVVFNGAAAQTLPQLNPIFNNLTIATTGGNASVYNGIVVNGVLTINSGSTLSANGTFTGTFTTSGTGTFLTGVTNTNATPLPATNKTYTFHVSYNSTSAQTIVAGTYNGNLDATGGNRTLASSGVITVAGTFTAGSGTYTTTGSTLSLGSTATIPTLTGANYNNLVIAGGTLTAPSTLAVNGDFTISSGATFIAPSTNFTVGGNWSNSGTYTHNNGSVIFNGSNQTITGSTNFYDFTKSVATAATLTFSSGATQGFAGTLTLSGVSGQLLTLASSTASVANINVAASNVSYVAVSNNNNTGTSIDAFNSTDNGNNTGWSFAQVPPTWTGTNSSNWNDANNWTPVGIPASNAVVTIAKTGAFDLAIETSPTVASLTISSGNNVTLLDGKTLTLNGGLTNEGTFTADETSTVTVAGNALIAGAGTTAFNNLTINGGATLSGAGFSVSGVWTKTGTFSHTSGTVVFNGTAVQTIPANISFVGLSITNTSASVTAGGALTVTNNINIASGATLNMGSNVLTFSGTTTTGTGTLTTQNTSSSPIPASKTWSFAINFNNTSGGQTIPGSLTTVYNGLTISNTSGNNSANGQIQVNGNFDITNANSNLSMGTSSFVVGTSFSTSGSGTLSTANITGSGALNTLTNAGGTGQVWNFTVRFNGAGKQTLPRGTNTFNNLIIAATDTVSFFNNTIVNGVLTINSGSRLATTTNTLTGTFTTSGTGTLTTLNTSSTPIVSGKTYSFNVVYFSTSSQTIVGGTYNNALTVSGGNRTFSSTGTIVIAGAFTPGAGTFTGTGSSVTFAGTTTQTVPSATYANLTITNTSATVSAAGNISISTNLNVPTNAILDMGTYTLGINNGASTSGTGTVNTQNISVLPISGFVTWSFLINFNNATGGQSIPAGTYSNLTISNTSGTSTAVGNITVSNNLAITNAGSVLDMNTRTLNCSSASFTTSGSGTLYNQFINNSTGINSGGNARTWSFTVVFNATNGPQTLPQGGHTFNNLTIANTSGNNVFTFGSYTINGVLSISNGCTMSLNGHNLLGSFTTSGTGTLTTSTTSASVLPTGKTYTFNVLYSSASSQTIVAGTYNGTLNGNGGNRILSNTGTITIGADFVPGSGTYTNTGSTVSFSGTSAQTIPALTFNNLTINNNAGVSLGGNVTVNDALTLTNGNISLAANNLTLGSAATIVGTPSASKYIIVNGNGRFIRNAVGNTAVLFPIGTATSYVPLTITNTTGTSNLSTSVKSSFTNAPIDANQMVNLEWSVLGSTSTTATIAFQFNTADKAAGYNVGTNDLGIVTTGTVYAISSITTAGTTTISGTKTGVAIPSSGNHYLVIGNSGAVESPFTTWTSNFNTVWSNAANWSNGVPTIGTDPIIAATNASPVFTGTQTVGKLVINSGATLVNNGTLSATGLFTINGTISGTGTTVLSGSSAQSIVGTGTVKNFTLNNSAGATVTSGNNKLNISGILTLQSGQFTTNSNVVLKSTSITNSATLAPVGISGNTGSISGTVQVERFIPKAYRAWRDMAPGVFNAGSIYNNWQEAGSYANNGYGLFITGTTAATNTHAVDATTGLDQTTNSVKSAYTFTDGTWSAITNTKTTNLNPFLGYRLLVRGDRSFNLYTTPISTVGTTGWLLMNAATALRATGNLITGNVVYSTSGITNTVAGATYNSASFGLNSSSTTGFSSVANPYVAPIDWKNIWDNNRAVNLTANYYYLDPTLGSTGAYVSYNAVTDATSNGAIGSRRYIQAGQAFFVENNSSTAPSLTITEADKAIGSTKTSVFGNANHSRLTISLVKSTGSELKQMDGATVVFDPAFSNDLGREDAKKMTNPGENLSINHEGQSLSIEGRKPATTEERLPLSLSQLATSEYQLTIDAAAYKADNLQLYLVDAFKKGETLLTSGINNISFTVVGNNPATYANRFSVVFKAANKVATTATPIVSSNLSVYPNPLVGKTITVRLGSEAVAGKYVVNVYNSLGQQVHTGVYNYAGSVMNCKLPQALAKGGYQLLVVQEGKVVGKSNLIVE